MKRKKGEMPYQKYWVYGPILNSTENRRVIVLLPMEEGDKRTTVSYARYLLATHLGRELSSEEHVDHIDGDKLNDVVSNLQILTVRENNEKHRLLARIERNMVELKCPGCGEIFVRRKNQTHLSKRGVFSACSRHCSGSVRKKMQQGEQIDLSENVIRIYRESVEGRNAKVGERLL